MEHLQKNKIPIKDIRHRLQTSNNQVVESSDIENDTIASGDLDTDIEIIQDVDMKEMVDIVANRRKLLKYAFFGTGIFVLGKIFGPSINIFGEDTKITDFKNFRVIESKLGLQFFDKFGNEILVLDKDS